MPPENTHLRIVDWNSTQHYKHRRPPWVKLHRDLLDDYELAHLAVPTRLLYFQLLLLVAGTEHDAIPNDPAAIAWRTNIDLELVTCGIRELINAHRIEVTDPPQANR